MTVAEACFPSMVATITASPAASPVTVPDEDTLASAGVLLDHVTGRPLSTWPLTFLAIAMSCVVWPIVTVAVDGVISTAATGSGATFTVAVPVAPSLVAVTVADPVDRPVTTPCDDTVATWTLLDE